MAELLKNLVIGVSRTAGMDHMRYLRDVALADVAHLEEKEKTYRGSWKRRGGRGVFHVGLARVWDRLENIATGGGEDIFGIIEAESDTLDPATGAARDGTLLACVRDLRTYLMLIEAECLSRGMAGRPVSREKPPYVPGTPEDGGHHALYENNVEVIVDESGAGGGEGGEGSADMVVAHHGLLPEYADWTDVPKSMFDLYEKLAPAAPARLKEVISEAQHARLWEADGELAALYCAPAGPLTREWFLNRATYPRPRQWDALRTECNAHELGQMPAWKHGLYEWKADQNKYRLKKEYTVWTTQTTAGNSPDFD